MLETNKNKKISMFRGDTLSFTLKIKGLEGRELTAAYFTCRDRNETLIFQKSLGDGITKLSADPLIYRVRVAPEDTEDQSPGMYKYDTEIHFDSDTYTILAGPLVLLKDETY